MLGGLVYFVLLATFAGLTYRKPHAALVAVLCMFGLEQIGQVYIAFLRTNGLFTNLFVLLLVAFAVFYLYVLGRFSISFRYHDCRVRVYSIALYLFALMSLMWTPVDGWIYWSSQWPYLLVSLIMAPLLINRIGDLEEVQKTFIWVGGAMIVFLAFVPEWGTRSLVISGTAEQMRLPLALASNASVTSGDSACSGHQVPAHSRQRAHRC